MCVCAIAEPGYGSKTPSSALRSSSAAPATLPDPGGPFFNFAGFGKDEASLKTLKLKEVKNARLAMLACLGYFIQAIFTGVGPFQNLLDHLSDPLPTTSSPGMPDVTASAPRVSSAGSWCGNGSDLLSSCSMSSRCLLHRFELDMPLTRHRSPACLFLVQPQDQLVIRIPQPLCKPCTTYT